MSMASCDVDTTSGCGRQAKKESDGSHGLTHRKLLPARVVITDSRWVDERLPEVQVDTTSRYERLRRTNIERPQ